MNLFAIVAVLAAGCSPYSISGPRQPTVAAFGPARPDVGTVCVIRSSAWAQAVTFIVHDNRNLVGATRGESYFCYEAAPGHHTIVSDTFDATDHPGTTTIAVVPGARYWLNQDHANSFGSVTSKLEWVDEARARELIQGCSYKVVTSAPGHETLPSPVPFAPAA